MAIQTGYMPRSSYVKLFFPCSESGADVDAVDVIRSATQSDAATLVGDGLEITAPFVAASSALGSGDFPTIPATSDFMVFTCAGNINVTGEVFLGNNSSGQRVAPVRQAGAMEIATASELVTWSASSGRDLVNPKGHAIVCKRGEDLEYVHNGTVYTPNSANKQLTEAFTPASEMKFSTAEFYGVAIFEFPDGIPSDYAEAVEWMGDKWGVGQKIIWPEWENA